jgi:hypothetical protein
MNTNKVSEKNLSINSTTNNNEGNKNTCTSSSNEKFNIKMFDYTIF